MELVCPECKTKLLESTKNEGYNCTSCRSSYPIVKGIPSFLGEVDNFYEGKFAATQKSFDFLPIKILVSVYHAISISSSRQRFIKKAFKKILTNLNKSNSICILDLGCGGGREGLTRFGEVTGIDISFSSLQQAQKVYGSVVHANIGKMPFPDEYFDIVFSTDVMGHVPLEEKDRVLSEIFRVTRKEGFSIHSFECDSESLFYKWAKKYPDLHQKYFVEMYGHVGLECSKEAFKRFRKAGFAPVLEITDPTKGYLRGVQSYVVFFDNELKNHSRIIKSLVGICKLLSTSKIIRIISNFIIGFFTPLASLITPKSHRDSGKVIYKKPLGQ